MPSLADTLGSIPGYSGFKASQLRNQQQEQGELQQAMSLQGLLAQVAKQQMDQQTKEALAQSGGDPEVAVASLIKAGNLQGAQALTPIAKMAAEKRQAEETAAGIKAIVSPQPVAPTDAKMIPVGTEAPAAPVDPRQARIEQLNRLSVQYAKNPVVVQRIQAEIDKLNAAGEKAPTRRERINGENIIQEEYVGGKWIEVGRGPRFARQVAPTGPVKERLVPVRTADGRVVYKKESEAEGQEVGGRVTDTNLPKAVQQLGRDFEKAGLPNTIAVLENAEKITPEMAAWLTGPGQLVPDRLAPPDAVAARQALAKLFNITLKDRSGAAVTNQELERLKEEFGKGLLRTPKSLIDAINSAKGIVEKHYMSIGATHGKEALDAYNANLEAIGGKPFKTSSKQVKTYVERRRTADGRVLGKLADGTIEEIKE